jgi:hypothetical protein
MGIAKLDKAGAFGMLRNRTLDGNAAQLVGGAFRRSNMVHEGYKILNAIKVALSSTLKPKPGQADLTTAPPVHRFKP